MPHYEFFCHACKEVIFESPVAGRLRRGRGVVPALRKQGRRAALVSPFRHRVEKERLTRSPLDE